MTNSKGTDLAETMAWGGSSSGSYAYAGPDGMIASAGLGGHAVAMSGSGSKFEARIMGPGGQILTRHWDGSTSMGKVREEKQQCIRYREEDDSHQVH